MTARIYKIYNQTHRYTDIFNANVDKIRNNSSLRSKVFKNMEEFELKDASLSDRERLLTQLKELVQ
jgi:hypothetical protein